MTTKQIKTFEQLIARELQGESGYNARVQAAYMEMYKHFSNEEYLYGIPHTQIITKIYTGGFYKHCSVGALSRELYYDFKTLLSFRKRYIELFARYYLNLEKKDRRCNCYALRAVDKRSKQERLQAKATVIKTPCKTH